MRFASTRIVALLPLLASAILTPPPARGDGGESSHRAGTVDTLAGPGFCAGAAALDPISLTVRALAVDARGRSWWDTGPSASGLVGTVDSAGQVVRLVTGVAAPADDVDPLPPIRHAPAAGRMAPDGNGGLYLSGGATVVDVLSSGGVMTIAGDPASVPGSDGSGSSGDGGPAVDARFNSARSVARDELGNLYVADEVDRRNGAVRIRMINRGDRPVTVYPGTAQELVVPPGHIDTIAGSGTGENSGDGGSALRAGVEGVPPSLAVAGGRLYLGLYWREPGSGRTGAAVRVVNLGGSPINAQGRAVAAGGIETVAGGGPTGFAGDGGPARSAAFSYLPGIAATPAGDLYLADVEHHRVRRVDPTGRISTFAGSGSSFHGGFDGNGRPARDSRLNRPYDVKVRADGAVLIADQLNGQVRMVDPGGVIHAAPGAGVGRSWVCGGAGAENRPGSRQPPLTGRPASVTADSEGNVYVALRDANQVKRIDQSGRVTTVAGGGQPGTYCGLGCPGFSGDGGPAEAARLASPAALAIGPRSDLYILDAGNARVRVVNLGPADFTVHGVTVAPGTIRTVAGDGAPGSAGDGQSALHAHVTGAQHYVGVLGIPGGQELNAQPVLPSLAADSSGNLLIGDGDDHRVRQIDTAGIITTVAGVGAPGRLGDCCHDPYGLAVDAWGTLYVSDRSGAPDRSSVATHPRVWAINRQDRPISVLGQIVPPRDSRPVAGNGMSGFVTEGGRAVESPLLPPVGIAVDRRGHLFIAELGSVGGPIVADVVEVDDAGIVRTLVGSSRRGFNGDGLPGRLTALDYVAGIAVDPCRNLLISDLGNDRVRRLDLVPPCRPAGPIGGGGPAVSGSWPQAVLAAIAGAGLSVAALIVLSRRRRRAG